MRRATGAGNDYLEPGFGCALGEIIHPVGRAMRGHDPDIGGDAELVEHFDGAGHGLPVRLAPHDDRDLGVPGGGHLSCPSGSSVRR